jgi:hypothetical protein
VDLTRPLDVDAGAIESPDDADTPDDGGMPPLDAPADQQVSPEAGTGDGASDRPTSDARDAPAEAGPDVPPSTLSMGLVGWWKLDALNALTTPDASGLGNTASILGGPTVLTGNLPSLKFTDAGAFHFSQQDAAVVSPVAAALMPAAAITVAAWVRLTTPANRGVCGGLDPNMHYILHHRNNRGVGNQMLEGVALTKQGDGTLAFTLTSNSGLRDVLASKTKPATGIWFHIAGTFDGTQMVLYVNGSSELGWSHPYPIDYDSTRPWYLARSGECGAAGEDTYDAKLNGDLDDVRIYNRALTSGEIFALYSGYD